MKLKIILIFVICFFQVSIYAQLVKLKRINSGNDDLAYYKIEVYNNTTVPICLPVSADLGNYVSPYDTLQLGDSTAKNTDTTLLSLYFTKSYIVSSWNRYPAIPVIINPGTCMSTNFCFVNSQDLRKKIFIKLQVCYKDVLFSKISEDFNNQPAVEWMHNLKFISKLCPLLEDDTYDLFNESVYFIKKSKRKKENIKKFSGQVYK